MSITASFGMDYFKPLVNNVFSTLDQLGKLPFISNHANDGDSQFRFTQRNERIWLTSFPTSSTRAEIMRYDNSCIRRNRPPYNNCLERRGWVVDVSATHYRRRIDSSRRTPAFSIPFTSLWSDCLNKADIRYFVFGCRLFLPSVSEHPIYPFHVLFSGGDTAGVGSALLHRSELPPINNVEIFFECQLDRETGVVRRWIDDVELTRRFISPGLLNVFNGLHLHVGGKSNAVTSGPPSNSQYSICDFYAAADTNDPNELPSRLGDVTVNHLPLDDFLLNRFWEPPTGEPPVEVVSRVKVSHGPTTGLTADVHADPARGIFNEGGVVLDDDEIIHVSVTTHGHRITETPVGLITTLTRNQQPLISSLVDLPLNTFASPFSVRPTVMIEKTIDGDADLLKGLGVKIAFKF